MTPVELYNLAAKLRTITANKQDDVFIGRAADEIVKALTEIDNLKAQLKSELAAHESWQNEYLRIDGEQLRRIRELEAELGDLPRAQADMLATIKSQRMVLVQCRETLRNIGYVPRTDGSHPVEQLFAAIKEILK